MKKYARRILAILGFSLALAAASAPAGCGSPPSAPAPPHDHPSTAMGISPQGGTITSVLPTSGGGLAGGGGGGAVTLGLLTSCSTGQTLAWSGSAWTCGAGGITNSAGNHVVPVSDGTNFVASGESDDGTTFSVGASKLTVTRSSGNTLIAGTLGITGLTTVTGGITGLPVNSTCASGTAVISSSTTGVDTCGANGLATTSGVTTSIDAAVAGTSGQVSVFNATNTITSYAAFTSDSSGNVGVHNLIAGGSIQIDALAKETSGTGAPGASCTVGDEWHRTDGGVGTTLYYCSATNTWTPVAAGAGTVTSVATGTGLTGGAITSTGTLSLNINGGTTQTATSGQAFTAMTGAGILSYSAFVNSVGASTGLSLSGSTISGVQFNSTTNGYTPLSGGGTTNYLRADGSWAAPPGGSSLTNSAGNNVITKSNGTNLVASSITDTGSALSTSDGSFAISPSTASVNLGDGSTSYLRYVATPSANFIESGTSSSTGHAATLNFTDINASNTWMSIGTTGAVSITSTLTIGSGGLYSSTNFTTNAVNNSNGAAVVNANTAETATNFAFRGYQNGTYNTTGGALSSTSLDGVSIATRASGSNALTNIGVHGYATGAQVNHAFMSDGGDESFDSGSFTSDGAGNVTVTTLTLNGALNANSHKITSVTDGSNPHDAVAFDQLAAAISGGVSGTAPQTAIFGSTNSVISGWASDNGSTWGVTSKFVINESTGATDIYGTLDLHGALVASAGATTVGNFAGTICSTTATGTQTDWAPSCLATASTIANTASTTLTINTLTGGVVGRRVRIKNLGTGEVIVKNNGSGTAGNKLLNDGTFDVELYAASYGATDCSADYEYYSDNNWHEVAFNCSTIGSLATGGGVQIQFNNNLTGVSQLQANNINVNASAFTVSSAGAVNTASTINATGFVQSSAEVFAGSLDVYLNTTNSGNIGFQDGVNATASGYINAVGYLEGTTQYRDLHIQDGKGNDILVITGSTKLVAASLALEAASFIESTGSYIQASTSIYAGGNSATEYLNSAGGGLGCLYSTNAAGDCFINGVGYQEGTTQPRNLRIQNGEGVDVANFNGTTKLVTVANSVSGINGEQAKHLEWNDDWNQVGSIPVALTGVPLGSVYSATLVGAGGTITQIAGNAAIGRAGIMEMHTGNAASGNVAVMTGAHSVNFSEGNYSFATNVGWPTLSTSSASSATRYVSLLGFFDTPTSVDQVTGCYFLYDVGNVATSGANSSNTQDLEAVCVSASARTVYLLNGTGTCDSSFAKGTVTIAAYSAPSTNMHRLSVVLNGDTSAAFYDGSTEVCLINTHVPTIVSTRAGHMILEEATSGTGDVLLDVDQTTLSVDLTSTRSP